MFATSKFLVGSVNFGTVRNYCIYKQSRMLKKLLDKGLKNQKNGKNSTKKLAQQVLPAFNQGSDRRLSAINKVYMQHITEVMQGEKYSSHLVDLGVEVSKVKVLKDHSYINVYWISKNKTLDEEELQKVLKKASGELQKEICLLRHIGKLPELRFVRDVNLERQIEVEKLLSVVDLGKNFEGSQAPQAFGSGPFLEEDGKTPEMRQNVLGLDHGRIRDRILVDIGKFQNIELPEKDFEHEEVDSRNLIPFDRSTFEKFYHKRQILKRKMKQKVYLYINEADNSNNEGENQFSSEYWRSKEFEETEDEEDFYRNQDKNVD